MTCLEAQSNIMAFIDKKLPEDKVSDFVRHMRYCKNCAEELEIYYTLIIGIRQVDNNEELSQNFKQELDDELNRLEHKVKKAKRFRISTFSVVFIAAVIAMFFCYGRILNKVYNIEQVMIKQEQGDYYFYDHFGDEIELCREDMIAESRLKDKPKELTYYERIRLYNRLHADDDTEETVDNAGETGTE